MRQVFKIVREPVVVLGGSAENFTPGKMYLDRVKFCETCEDEDRFLEKNLDSVKENKIYGRTAIPRGMYRLGMRFSPKFGRMMPWVMDVPGFEYIMLHGANRAEDLHGCVGTGKVRTKTGIAECKDVVERISNAIESANELGIESWLKVE